MSKFNVCVSLMTCLMVAGASKADLIYDLTSDEGLGGTITLDIALAADNGTEVTYSLGAGVVDFSLVQPGNPNTTHAYTLSDGPFDFDVVFNNGGTAGDASDDTALTWFGDIDNNVGDSAGSGAMFGTLNFSVASQNFDTFSGTVTNAALTPQTVAVPEPSTFALAVLGLMGLVGFRRRLNRTASHREQG